MTRYEMDTIIMNKFAGQYIPANIYNIFELGIETGNALSLDEVSAHLLEAGYTYDSNMGIGDNIGSALLKEYANGYEKGEQDSGTDEIYKFVEWCKTKGYSCYDWRMLIEQYEKEKTNG